ncbi:hypothetical protein RRG08_024772 [Elysia crispata]|uniref:Uncharacterized protein n=1 Tax=Elysia crispata TaxID=231223 RepID=A0AAE1CT94_9GAST|nr:hypothetical protein RRG08_024772 [Elysia crispata]
MVTKLRASARFRSSRGATQSAAADADTGSSNAQDVSLEQDTTDKSSIRAEIIETNTRDQAPRVGRVFI